MRRLDGEATLPCRPQQERSRDTYPNQTPGVSGWPVTSGLLGMGAWLRDYGLVT